MRIFNIENYSKDYGKFVDLTLDTDAEIKRLVAT